MCVVEQEVQRGWAKVGKGDDTQMMTLEKKRILGLLKHDDSRHFLLVGR